MKHYLLVIFIIIGCKKSEIIYDAPKEDISTLIELSLNSCADLRSGHHLKFGKHNKYFISFYKLENPLKRRINFFGILLNDKINDIRNKDNLIEIYFYKKISPTKFQIRYMISNKNIDVITFIEYINGKWIVTNCDIGYI